MKTTNPSGFTQTQNYNINEATAGGAIPNFILSRAGGNASAAHSTADHKKMSRDGGVGGRASRSRLK